MMDHHLPQINFFPSDLLHHCRSINRGHGRHFLGIVQLKQPADDTYQV
ncbi:hypothetical protein KSS87_011087, partial [Heliosperma pusillum]